MKDVPPARMSAFAGRFAGALADPARQTRTALAILAAYVAAWTLYTAIATYPHDVHFDMAEIVAWSLEPAFGYPKHPPLGAWIVTLWFLVFPRADWAYYLLSFTTVATGLWFVWLLAVRYLDRDKRAVALVLLTLTPAFSVLAIKFNPNTLLIPLWAAATYTFLRSYEERTLRWGALAGFAAALAMLGKYWSLFLLIGFAVALVADPRRKAYLRSPAPWASVAVGFVCLAPHLLWILHNGAEGVDYAVQQHAMASVSALISTLLNYAVGGLLYMIVPIAAVVLAAQPRGAALRDMLWPADPRRRFIALVFWGGYLSPIVVSLMLSTRLDSLWTLSSFALLPVLLLGSPLVTVPAQAARAIVLLAWAFPLVMLIASPGIALYLHRQGTPAFGAQGSLLAREAERQWHAVTDRPLLHVAGTEQLAWAATFYGRDQPQAFPGFSHAAAPWIDPDAMVRDGWVGLCPAAESYCLGAARALAAKSADARFNDVEIARTVLGSRGAPEQFVVVVVPPQK